MLAAASDGAQSSTTPPAPLRMIMAAGLSRPWLCIVAGHRRASIEPSVLLILAAGTWGRRKG